MDISNTRSRSHLFTVRVWEEEIEPGVSELRGKVQLLISGEVRYFRGWTALVPLLVALLLELDSQSEPNQ
ncbi:hypothetical protein KSD_74350 [Ktedonobacter sp. SOSP1-85]|uniref:hypothetical protein n=1 Tax=Ktedonobacter sp. SOSP1-85 TaxID=2778367 RepID=UPI0019155769|nr:hypothetical protein [Ktedonobacter sp. SOSP1-85]GHO79664.1 hypothetical protein KSD_74350 [Ktedonobacter sp. SOSP1-85]